jgi:hypothetical protein
MRPKFQGGARSNFLNLTLIILIVFFVVLPLYIITIFIAIRSGLFSSSEKSLTGDESKAIWGLIGSAITASATLIALLVASNQNRRSEYRLTMDTAVRGIALSQSPDGSYGTNAVVAGSLATLAHLDHPVIAMRMLAAAWRDNAVDTASAVWLINEVLIKGTPESQLEAVPPQGNPVGDWVRGVCPDAEARRGGQSFSSGRSLTARPCRAADGVAVRAGVSWCRGCACRW